MIDSDELPSVAVIIPAYNAERFIGRAVQSVLDTGYPNLTIAIVDDGSCDNTLEIASQICLNNPLCSLFYHEGHQNKGVSASRNLGIDKTESEWVAFLDADDTYAKTRFDCLYTYAHRSNTDQPVNHINSDALQGAEASQKAYLNLTFTDQPTPSSAGQNHKLFNIDGFYGLTAMIFEQNSYSLDHKFWSQNNLFGISTPVEGVHLLKVLLAGVTWATSAITLRRSLLQKTGGFDISKNIAEDCDLWFRIVTIGKIVPYNLSRPISYYHRHSTNTYHYRIEHRLAVLKAMLDSWQWAESVHCPPERLQTYPSGVLDYAYRSIIAGQQAKRLDVVWSIFELMFAYRKYNFFLQFRVIRQYRILILRYIDNINLRLNSSELK